MTRNIFGALRLAAMAAVLGLAAAPAAAVTVGFDHSGTVSTVVTVGGHGSGLDFELNFGAPAGATVEGDFTLEVRNKDDATISLVNFLGLSFNPSPAVAAYGDTTIPPGGLVLDFAFTDTMTWSVSLTPDDTGPLSLIITSTLTPSANFGPFSPQLDVGLSGDLYVASAPAALPLFIGGLGMIGWLGRRRRGPQA
ncbi:MAG: hypothetical protein AB7P02_31495 [Alphaproteobacteria bacterium]